jgi:Fe-S-cluster containining protein
MAENEWISGKVGLRVHGLPMEFEMTVPATPVKPYRMLPVFQQMANQLVDVSVAAVESDGEKISCKAGCGACCRQAVPISETEIYQIADLVESMPEPKRSEVKKRFAAAAEHFNKIGWYDRFIEFRKKALQSDASEDSVKEGIDIVLEYFHEGIPCPFLEDESCSIHPSRPVACREYLVTTPAANCARPAPNTVQPIDLLIKPSRALAKLGTTDHIESIGFPVLTRALEVAEMYPEKFEEKTGPDWMKDFFSELSRSDIQESVKPA